VQIGRDGGAKGQNRSEEGGGGSRWGQGKIGEGGGENGSDVVRSMGGSIGDAGRTVGGTSDGEKSSGARAGRWEERIAVLANGQVTHSPITHQVLRQLFSARFSARRLKKEGSASKKQKGL